MSHKASSWAFDQPLKGNLKLLLLAIADCHSDEMGAFPKISSLCKKASISNRTYKRLIAELEELGYLKREERFTEIGRQTSNYFTLNMGEGCQAVTPRSLSPLTGDTVVTPLTYNVSNNVNGRESFSAFWSLYPKKVKKRAAERTWSKLKACEQEAILKVLPNYVFAEEDKYIPGPQKWLNDGSWEDEVNGTELDEFGGLI